MQSSSYQFSLFFFPFFCSDASYYSPFQDYPCPCFTSFQVFTLALAIDGFGIEISVARNLGFVRMYHPIIGMVTVPCLVLFQPAIGFIQHRYFLRTRDNSVFAFLRWWVGLCLVVLGVINAGRGFRLTGVGLSIAPAGAVITYGVVAGILGPRLP